jgi:asparagine synthetase B (glutamine-hydrolysing)
MAMRYSIETRIPFLDYKLVEYMAGIDKSVKMDFLQRKSVLINTF